VTMCVPGAGRVVLLFPLLMAMCGGAHRHYERLTAAGRAETPLRAGEIVVRAIVPVAELGVDDRQALAFAQAITPDPQHVIAVHVADTPAAAEAFRRLWEAWAPGTNLVLIESPLRSLIGPLLAFIHALKRRHPDDTLAVVLPEFVPSHWWEHLLHNQTALRIKAALLFQPGIIVANVPYHLGEAA